jgi:hypothetical protein
MRLLQNNAHATGSHGVTSQKTPLFNLNMSQLSRFKLNCLGLSSASFSVQVPTGHVIIFSSHNSHGTATFYSLL